MEKSKLIKEVALAVFLFSIPFIIHGHIYFSEKPYHCFISGIEIFNSLNVAVWSALIYFCLFGLTIVFYTVSNNLIKVLGIPLIILTISLGIDNILPISSKYWSFELTVSIISIAVLGLTRHVIFDRKTYFGFPSSLSNLVSGYTVALFLYTVFFIYILLIMPMGIDEIKIYSISITDMGFPSVSALFFYLINKIGIILLSVLCFFKVKRWWRFSLLSPMLLSLYQMTGAFNPTQRSLDEFEVIYAIPMLVTLAFFLYFLFRSEKIRLLTSSCYQLIYRETEKKLLINNKREEFINSIKTKLEKSRVHNADFTVMELINLKKELKKELESTVIMKYEQ